MKAINPINIAAPASNYSQAVLVPENARRLIISGQIGVNPDGSIAKGIEAQMERCWLNIFAILEDANMAKTDLVKITVFVTQSGVTGIYRDIRDRMLEGHAPAATYLVISELATPDFLVEIEAEALGM